MRKSIFIIGIMALVLSSCQNDLGTADYRVVPLPKEIKIETTDSFVLDKHKRITYPKSHEELRKEAEFLADYIEDILGFRPSVLATENQMANAINLELNNTDFDNEDSYQIIVDKKFINITSSNTSGIFYGIQTLRKSLPLDNNDKVDFPVGVIKDHPRFGYRGMHLDVSRHFFPIDSLKVFIDVMALHNLNKFHIHITDDQGWRFEVKKYPELTNTGAWRNGTIIGKSMAYDTIRYGGFYTQEELRDLVSYAADRHITIIPEIDLPGHMVAALAAYPELGCTGGPYEVWRRWGVSEDVICAGNEKAMRFLEDVLTEVMYVFPSEYIHIGGDEVPRTRWEKCPKCQAKIKELGLKSDDKHSAEDYLQSYVMARMEAFLESHGRHIIGWDEMLEGELAPNATVMSWRGSSGGYQAAKMHHNVIMTPNDVLYFDYYQTLDTDSEPISIGGYNPVKKVYLYEPIPDGLTEDEQKYILGPQANIWTEYTSSFNLVMYRMIPRIGALAEMQWCLPEQKNYEDWVLREYRMSKLYDLYKWNYATHIFDIDVKITPIVNEGYIEVSISKLVDGDIMYFIDDQEPQEYTEPVKITKNCKITCYIVRPDGSHGKHISSVFDLNKASMKPISLKTQPNKQYAYNGQNTLIDGLHGNTNYRSGRWLGWFGENLDATIDMLKPTEVSKVRFNLNVNMKDWIFNAKSVKVLVSDDGKHFNKVAHKKYDIMAPDYTDDFYPIEVDFSPVTTRYIEIVVEPFDCPKGHDGYGYPAWIFVDELGIY